MAPSQHKLLRHVRVQSQQYTCTSFGFPTPTSWEMEKWHVMQEIYLSTATPDMKYIVSLYYCISCFILTIQTIAIIHHLEHQERPKSINRSIESSKQNKEGEDLYFIN